MPSHLADLGDLKVALGIDLNDTEDDAKYDFALEAASDAIRRYTDRDFTLQATNAVATSREFEYDGTGYIDIDDCTLITAVTVDGTSLDTDRWRARPYNGPVFNFIEMPYVFLGGESPAMGFKRNLDRYPYDLNLPALVSITAKWGWTRIPRDVQQATIWTAVALSENPRPFMSESIEGYSRTVGPAPAVTIPDRAAAALAPYIRITV